MKRTYPTADEMLVNQHLLGQCLHEDFKVIRGFLRLFTKCQKCQAQEELEGRQTNAEVSDLWRSKLIRPALNPINAAQVERKLSLAGWVVTIFQRDRCSYRCEAGRGGQRLHSDVCSSRSEAVVQVAAQIIRKGWHK